MTKLAELGIVWIEDTSWYCAHKTLYQNAEEFLTAVLSHIKELVDTHSEAECGWFEVPEYDKYISLVTTSWMTHRVNSEWHDAPFWESVDEPGKGHTPVWFIDFELIKL